MYIQYSISTILYHIYSKNKRYNIGQIIKNKIDCMNKKNVFNCYTPVYTFCQKTINKNKNMDILWK